MMNRLKKWIKRMLLWGIGFPIALILGLYITSEIVYLIIPEKMDTVYVERRDSILVKNTNQARASPFENTLKWGLFIVIALIGLILVLGIRG